MATIISCCNKSCQAREFFIEPKGNIWRCLVFLDECPNCGKAVAEIRTSRYDGKLINEQRRVDKAAIALYEKYRNAATPIYKLKKGTKANMSWTWFDGAKDLWVRDFNNIKLFKISNDIKIVV